MQGAYQASVGAVSPSSQTCVKYPSNPVLNDSGEYPTYFSNVTLTNYATHYEQPSVLKVGGTYEMWFSGAVDNVSGIFTSTSFDGVAWSVRSAPVLTPGANGTWDSSAVYSPDVIWNGSMYLMYYTGTGNGPDLFRQVGLATSSDMVHWQKYQDNPVIGHGPGTYDAFYARFAAVLHDPPIYRMWYIGHSLVNYSNVPSYYIAVDYATSTDGVHWTKADANPVYGGGANWANNFFEHPSVFKINGTFIMAGDNGYEIAYLTSQDGIHWANDSQVLVGPSAEGWDNGSVLYPSLLVQGSSVMIWYTGLGQIPHEEYFDGIGLATCRLLLVSTSTTETMTSTAVSTQTGSTVTSTVVSIQTTTATVTSTVVSTQTATATTTTAPTVTEVSTVAQASLGPGEQAAVYLVVATIAAAATLVVVRVLAKRPR